MPEKIAAKYTGKNDEHYMGVPARDLNEEEFDALSDEHKAMLAQSSFYDLRHDAPAEAEKAAKRVEHAEPVSPMAEQAMAEMPEPELAQGHVRGGTSTPAPKDAPKAEAPKK